MAEYDPNRRQWLTTLLLCVLPALFGFFGIHRFYTGHILIGLVQLLTFGGCGIWWIIDIVFIATDQYRDVEGRSLAKS